MFWTWRFVMSQWPHTQPGWCLRSPLVEGPTKERIHIEKIGNSTYWPSKNRNVSKEGATPGWWCVATKRCMIWQPFLTSQSVKSGASRKSKWWTLSDICRGSQKLLFFFAGVHAPFFVIVTQDSVPSATDINECLALPCHNGGTCRNLVGSFQCECAEGFSGKRCKTGRVHGGGGALWGLNTHNPHIHVHTHVSCMLQTWTSACRSPVSTAGPARTGWVPMCVTALKASEASAVNLVRGQPTSISVLLHLFLTCAV